jgi:hypothetical protein
LDWSGRNPDGCDFAFHRRHLTWYNPAIESKLGGLTVAPSADTTGMEGAKIQIATASPAFIWSVAVIFPLSARLGTRCLLAGANFDKSPTKALPDGPIDAIMKYEPWLSTDLSIVREAGCRQSGREIFHARDAFHSGSRFLGKCGRNR